MTSIETELAVVEQAMDKRGAAASIAQRWVEFEGEPVPAARDRLEQLIEPLSAARTHEVAWIVAIEVCERLLTSSDDHAALATIHRWLSDDRVASVVKEAQLHRLANRLAWATRGASASLDGVDVALPADRFLVMLELERMRFLFAYQRIDVAVRGLGSTWHALPIVSAVRLFSTMNQSADPATLLPELRQLWHASASDELRAPVADILLHTVWLCYRLPDQGEQLVRLATEALTEQRVGEPIARFRRAAGYRELGRWDEAVDDLSAALNRLSGASEFVRTFSEQIIREREFVLRARTTGDALARAHEEIERSKSDINAAVDEFRKEVREIERSSLSRTIEIVTLFTAAVAFAIGATNIVGQGSGDVADRIIMILGLSIGLLSFAALIVGALVMVSGTATPRGSRIRPISAFLFLIAIQVAGLVLVAVLA